MKILVLNGNTKDPSFDTFTEAIESAIVENTKHEIEYFRLKDMDIKYCTGCWSCWYKTPGYCAIKDDHEQILSRIPNADLVMYISPVILGYESALLKTCKDRSIPSAHPYIMIYEGEQHHHERYQSMPDIGVLLIGDDETGERDIHLIRHAYDRMALNFQTKVKVFDVVTEIGGVKDVFDRI